MDKAQGNDSGDWNLALGKSAFLLLGSSFNSRSLNFPNRNQRYFLALTLLPYSLMMQLLQGVSCSSCARAEHNQMIVVP